MDGGIVNQNQDLWKYREEVCSCMLGYVDFEGLIFLVSIIPSDSYALSTSSSPGFLGSWEEKFDENMLFRAECSQGLSLSAEHLAVDLYVFSFA